MAERIKAAIANELARLSGKTAERTPLRLVTLPGAA
jgi:hypothetical protein